MTRESADKKVHWYVCDCCTLLKPDWAYLPGKMPNDGKICRDCIAFYGTEGRKGKKENQK